MISFDADVLTEILAGKTEYIHRAAKMRPETFSIPIVVIEEMTRGRLNVIRRAESGNARISIAQAYQLFYQTLQEAMSYSVLQYTDDAELLFQNWRSQKIRVGTHDMRIAAICVVNSATLISRNRQDFSQLPGLKVEYWN